MARQENVLQVRDRRPWTEEEDQLLRVAIEQEDPESNPPTRWHAISQHIPHRTNKDCRKRWWAQMATVVSKGSWTSDEDERLRSAVHELGTKWALIADRVKTRNSGQCAKRWNDTLNPSIDRSGWSHEEDEQLLNAVERLGHSWANIVRTTLPGRTGLAAKNRYNHLMRGACREIGTRGHRPSSRSVVRRKTRGSLMTCSSARSSSCRRTSNRTSSDEWDSANTPSTPSSIEDTDGIYLHALGNTTEPSPTGDTAVTPDVTACHLSPLSFSSPNLEQGLFSASSSCGAFGAPMSPHSPCHPLPSSSASNLSSMSLFLPVNARQPDPSFVWLSAASELTTPAALPAITPPIDQSLPIHRGLVHPLRKNSHAPPRRHS